MVRSYLKVTLASALVCNGWVAAQSPYRTQQAAPAQPIQHRVVPAVASTPAAQSASSERYIYVDEPGKGKQKCLVLREWTTAEGRKAMEVRSVASGEIMTIAMPGASASAPTSSRVFRWSDNAPPPGAPTYSVSSVPSQPSRVVPQPAPVSPQPANFPAPVAAASRPTNAPAPTMVSRPPAAPAVVASRPQPVAPVAAPRSSPYAVSGGASQPASAPQPTMNYQPTVVQQRPVISSNQPTVVHQPSMPVASHGPIYMRQADVPELVIMEDSEHLAGAPSEPKPGLLRRVMGAGQQQTQPAMAAKESKPAPAQMARRTYQNPVQRGEFAKHQPAKTETAPAVASLPPPTDIRQSWGKTTEPAQANSVQAIVKAPDLSPPPVPTMPTPAPKVEAALPEVTASLAVKNELPKAEAKAADPLMEPEAFSRRAEINNDVSRSPLLSSWLGMEKKETKPAKSNGPAGIASTKPNVPLGARSVIAAYGNTANQVVYLPVPVVTMPERTQMPLPPRLDNPPPPPPGVDDPNVNAFSPGPQDQLVAYQQQMMQQQQMAAYHQMMAQQQMMHQQAMMQQAMGQQPDLVAQQQQLMQRMAQAAQQSAVPVGYQTPAAQQGPQPPNAIMVQQLMQALKEELMPSQREWAADALAGVDGRLFPQVVDALVASSKEDLAGSVRAACIRSLAKMKVNSTQLVPIMQGLRADTDPRVRHEAEQVLGNLGVPPAPDVLPASGKLPDEVK